MGVLLVTWDRLSLRWAEAAIRNSVVIIHHIRGMRRSFWRAAIISERIFCFDKHSCTQGQMDAVGYWRLLKLGSKFAFVLGCETTYSHILGPGPWPLVWMWHHWSSCTCCQNACTFARILCETQKNGSANDCTHSVVWKITTQEWDARITLVDHTKGKASCLVRGVGCAREMIPKRLQICYRWAQWTVV